MPHSSVHETRSTKFEVFNEDMIGLVNANCAQLFILYSGGLGFGRNKSASAVASGSLHFLRRAGLHNRNVLLIRDRRGEDFRHGVGSEKSTFDDFLQWQIRFRNSLSHVRKLYCFGSSMGGYAAMVSGHRLRANRVWALAPRIARRTPDAECLEKLLARELNPPNGITEYQVHYSPDNAWDARTAAALRGIQGIALFPRNQMRNLRIGRTHYILVSFLIAGDLPKLFPSFLPAQS